ncbi:MAG: electron transfer flavoprotein subunit alpha/FixB family protein [Alphaproteobacteria bacterium]
MSTFVLAQHDNTSLHQSTLHAVTAARQLGEPIHLWVIGSKATTVAKEAARIEGIEGVSYVDAPIYEHPSAENVTALLSTYRHGAQYFVTASTAFGRSVMPYLAGIRGWVYIADVVGISQANRYTRSFNAGAFFAEEECHDPVQIITIRPTAFEPAGLTDTPVHIAIHQPIGDLGFSQFLGLEKVQSERPELTTAKVIVSGGRGVGSAQEFHDLIEPLADALGGAVGASRAAIDAGYATGDMQVGQTGKTVAPDLYIAAGISGQIQHLAGMKDSKVIVAINTDPDAPIFQIADYGLVADYRAAIPEILAALPARPATGQRTGSFPQPGGTA